MPQAFCTYIWIKGKPAILKGIIGVGCHWAHRRRRKRTVQSIIHLFCSLAVLVRSDRWPGHTSIGCQSTRHKSSHNQNVKNRKLCLIDRFWVTVCIGNGTKQGGLLSPCLFNCYVRKLIFIWMQHWGFRYKCTCICWWHGFARTLLESSSASAVNIRGLYNEVCTYDIDLECNVNKTVCMIFPQKINEKLWHLFFLAWSWTTWSWNLLMNLNTLDT